MSSNTQFQHQVLENQSNQEAEKTLGLVHTEQSFRNAKSKMTYASTSATIDSDSNGNDFTNIDSEEEDGDAE